MLHGYYGSIFKDVCTARERTRQNDDEVLHCSEVRYFEVKSVKGKK